MSRKRWREGERAGNSSGRIVFEVSITKARGLHIRCADVAATGYLRAASCESRSRGGDLERERFDFYVTVLGFCCIERENNVYTYRIPTKHARYAKLTINVGA